MKILKDNTPQKAKHEEIKRIAPYPRKLICEECRSELEYEKSDLRIGALGCCYVDCPCCGNDNMLEEHEDEIVLTKDNILFPTHFFHTSAETGAIDSCNEEEVKKCIQHAIDFFRKNKEEFMWRTQYGNLYISVSKYDGDEDYYVVVTNNYYSTYIPFEAEDYLMGE